MNLSNYAAKADLKEVTGIDTSTLVSKLDLASLKTEADNKGVDRPKNVSADLLVIKTVWFSETRSWDKDLEMLTKRYPIIVGWSRRLIKTQKLRTLKPEHLVLLV